MEDYLSEKEQWEWLKTQIIESIDYAYAEGQDKPEIRNWKWPLGR